MHLFVYNTVMCVLLNSVVFTGKAQEGAWAGGERAGLQAFWGGGQTQGRGGQSLYNMYNNIAQAQGYQTGCLNHYNIIIVR